MTTTAAALPLPPLGENFAPHRFGPFVSTDLARYAAASGDDNPLHLDPTTAEAAGLARPPVHGMLLMSCFEAALAAWRSDLTILRLSAKFLRPVLVDEGVSLSGRVARIDADGRIVLRLIGRDERGDLAIVGEATLSAGF